jgi:tellurite resistance protein
MPILLLEALQMTGAVLLFVVLAIVFIIWAVSKGMESDSQIERRPAYPPPPTPPPAPPKPPTMTWVPADQEIIVAGYTIRGGLFYTGHVYGVGGGTAATDPSMTDVDLPVRKLNPGETPPFIGYYPSYISFSPESRDIYLQWLAGGRSDPSTDIGYVFVFFYGLERRLLSDARKDEQAKAEVPAILTEVKRLLGIYGENNSFRGYATSFVEFCQYLYLLSSTDPQPPTEPRRGDFSLPLRFALADFSLGSRPIPPEWALSWLEQSLEYYPRTPARRCREEFVRLFHIRYRAEFGDGLVVKPNKTQLQFQYRAASGAFPGPLVLEAKGAPDITALKTPVNKFKEIAESCSDDLDSYSRRIGAGEGRPLSAIALLPRELLAESQTPEFLKLKEWLKLTVGSAAVTSVDLKTLLGFFSLEDCPKVPKADALFVVQLLGKLGYGFEPDPRFTGEAIEPAGSCVLFSADGALTAAPTAAYKTALVMMRLATTVVAADGTIGDSEKQVLENHIESVLDLSAAERTRLATYVHWLLLGVPDLAGMKKRLATWTPAQKLSAIRFMLFVANADNRIDPEEIKVLTKVYKLFELDPETLYSDLHAVQTRPDELPATILQPDARTTDRAIPKRTSVSRKKRPSGVALDAEAIQRTLEETHQVQQLLASVFVEEDVATPAVSSPAAPAIGAVSLLGLDTTHSSLLARLLTKPDWSRADLETLCAEFQVMADGAIDTINTAALEQYGDSLFDMADSLQVNQDIAKEVYA